MGLFKFIVALGKNVPACKPIANTLKEITDSLKRNFPLAQSKNYRIQVAEAKKNVQATAREMERSNTVHKLDINYGNENKMSLLDSLLDNRSSMRKPNPVKSPYQPSPTTKINRYGQDKGYGNSNIGNLLGH